MGERLHGMQEVVGSNPIGSIFIISCGFKVNKGILYTFRNIQVPCAFGKYQRLLYPLGKKGKSDEKNTIFNVVTD